MSAWTKTSGLWIPAFPSRISEREKERRRNLVMEEQALISREINSALIGTRQEVLVEGKGELSGYSRIGRCRRQAPEIDGATHLRGGDPDTGTIVACRIIAADDYDLFAEIL